MRWASWLLPPRVAALAASRGRGWERRRRRRGGGAPRRTRGAGQVLGVELERLSGGGQVWVRRREGNKGMGRRVRFSQRRAGVRACGSLKSGLGLV